MQIAVKQSIKQLVKTGQLVMTDYDRLWLVMTIVDASIIFQIIVIYGFILKHSNCDITAYLRPWIAISKV